MVSTPRSGAQYSLQAADYRAEIASIGATLRSLTYRGRDLTVPFAADRIRPAYRGATLAPWPNRVVGGAYRFDGGSYQLPLTEPERGHALHGLVAWTDFAATDHRGDQVTLETVIPPQLAYPWRVVVTTTYALAADGLTQTVTARNLGDTRAPWGTGPHPYLVAGPAPLNEWILELPARRVLTVAEDSLAPRELADVEHEPARFDFRSARAIGEVQIDHAFTSLIRDDDGRATVRLRDPSGSGVEIGWDDACAWVQIHTADRPAPEPSRVGLAVEPMTCAPDAFNADSYPFDTGLTALEPGATATASWRIGAAAG